MVLTVFFYADWTLIILAAAWECALTMAIHDAFKAGNVYLQRSKRFGRFDDFFMAESNWVTNWQMLFDARLEALPRWSVQRAKWVKRLLTSDYQMC